MNGSCHGKPLLGKFATIFGADESIGYLNLELDKPMFLEWVADLRMPKSELKRLHIYHAREKCFGRPDIKSDVSLRWFLDWITQHKITVVVIDTLSKLFDPAQWGGGSDPNVAYNRFWQAMETVKRDAELRGIFILHHTGGGSGAASTRSAMLTASSTNCAP
jgi:RecA-family ATPase